MKSLYHKIRIPLLIGAVGLLFVLLTTNLGRVKSSTHYLITYIAYGISKPDIQDRKIIGFGWNYPDLSDMPDTIDKAQTLPFDGFVFDENNLSWSLYSDAPVDEYAIEEMVKSVDGLEWGRLTNNFLRYNLHTYAPIDMHEDFSTVNANIELWARTANRLGFTGLFIDTEQYGGTSAFAYNEQPLRADYDLDDYHDAAFQRGEAFMQAINRGYPEVTIIFTFSLSSQAAYVDQGNLIYPFIEGMIAAADETQLVDGFEHSYTGSTSSDFAWYRTIIEYQTPEQLVEHPSEYREKMQVGFGLWMDHSCSETGFIREGCPNGFTPDTFSRAVDNALKFSDQYVWVYSERIFWFEDDPIYEEWLAAFD